MTRFIDRFGTFGIVAVLLAASFALVQLIEADRSRKQKRHEAAMASGLFRLQRVATTWDGHRRVTAARYATEVEYAGSQVRFRDAATGRWCAWPAEETEVEEPGQPR